MLRNAGRVQDGWRACGSGQLQELLQGVLFHCFHKELIIPAVVVSIDNLGRDGFGVARLCPHLLPEGVVLGDIHQLVLDVLPIEDSGHFALLGFDLPGAGHRRAVHLQSAHAAPAAVERRAAGALASA